MDPLHLRDEVFRGLHRSYLKPRGFVLRSLRSELGAAPITVAAVLHSQPWNTTAHADFDVMLVAAHAEFNPYSAHGLKSGVGLKDVQLLSLGVARLAKAGPFWSISTDSDPESVSASIDSAFREFALPVIDKLSSLKGILEVLDAHVGPGAFKPRSWILNFLGRHAEAIAAVNHAVAEATTENRRKDAVSWLAQLG